MQRGSDHIGNIRAIAREDYPKRCSRVVAAVMFTILSSTVFTGCDYAPFGYVSVKDILQNPTHYEGQKVKVRGTVTEVTKIPFLEIRFYSLSDNGSRIMVTTQGTIPPSGKEFTVIGVVENVAIIGNESVGMHLREMKRIERLF